MVENFNEYEGMTIDNFKYIPEISFYCHNYYIGLKRNGHASQDLIYAESDDDELTNYYYGDILFGRSYAVEGDIIHTGKEYLIG